MLCLLLTGCASSGAADRREKGMPDDVSEWFNQTYTGPPIESTGAAYGPAGQLAVVKIGSGSCPDDAAAVRVVGDVVEVDMRSVSSPWRSCTMDQAPTTYIFEADRLEGGRPTVLRLRWFNAQGELRDVNEYPIYPIGGMGD